LTYLEAASPPPPESAGIHADVFMKTDMERAQEDNNLSFAALLRGYAWRAGMTVEQLSEIADTPFDTVRNWVQGKARPRTWQDVVRLARALVLTAGSLAAALRQSPSSSSLG